MTLALVLAPVPVILVVAVVAVVMRRRMDDRWFAGTGREEWLRRAASLPVRDRWTLYRANIRGRAAPARLAHLAVHRGEVMAELSRRITSPGSVFRKIWVLGMAAALCNVGAAAALLMSGTENPLVLPTLVVAVVMVVLWAGMPALQRRQLRLIERSVGRNHALLGVPTEHKGH